MKSANISFFAILALFLSACGGGGGSSGGGEGSSSGGSASDFPDVSGDYSLTTSAIDYTCSDNSAGSIPPLSLNLSILQDNSMLRAPEAEPVPGFEFLDDSGLSGNVAMDRSFVMQKNVRAYIEVVDSKASVTYSLSGDFSSNGWSGDYEFSFLLDDAPLACTYVSTFTGSRTALGSSVAAYEDAVLHSGKYFFEAELYLELSEIGKGL